jgi:hypothetical protein
MNNVRFFLPTLSLVFCLLLFCFSSTPLFGQGKLPKYRSEPLSMLTYQQAESISVAKGFFDATWNLDGRGIKHKYEIKEINRASVVIDHATGLMWQQSGSDTTMTIAEARRWIQQLNQKDFAGFADWRLPTLEEAMTLLQPQKNKQQLYIDPVFDPKQQWIWTTDQHGPELVWVVLFDFGGGYEYLKDVINYVRAVRSGADLGPVTK